MSIIISKKGKDAERLERSDIDKEDYLQEYIHNNPDSIPIYELSEEKRLFVAKREFPTNAGPIDALAVDQDGEIYIVETKLYKNPDKRTVVAQALDYGAALWKHLNDFSEFLSILDDECQRKFDKTFQERLVDFFDLEEGEAEDMIETIRKNLDEGQLKFVILMDSMNERLKDLILYVNHNSQFDIYAAQLEYYKFEDYEIVIPRLFGVEVKKNINVSSSRSYKQWDETKFFEALKENVTEEEYEIVKSLYEFSTDIADKVDWGTGKNTGTFSVKIEKVDLNKSIYTIDTNGTLGINFGWLNETEKSRNFRDRYYEELVKISSFNLTEEDLEKYPNFKIEEWTPHASEFMHVVDGLV